MLLSFGVMDSLVDFALWCKWPLGLLTMVKWRAPSLILGPSMSPSQVSTTSMLYVQLFQRLWRQSKVFLTPDGSSVVKDGVVPESC